jgi:hypothetical protein
VGTFHDIPDWRGDDHYTVSSPKELKRLKNFIFL